MPPKPIHLQRMGLLKLDAPNTWDISIKDPEGKELAKMSAQEATEMFKGTDMEADLPVAPVLKPTGFKIGIQSNDFVLDGSNVPREPLTPEEALKVLQIKTGIY
jgi:hypothetical protein